MAYRDADAAEQARISALELELTQLRDSKAHADARELEQTLRISSLETALQVAQSELATERARARQEIALRTSEREHVRESLESVLEQERRIHQARYAQELEVLRSEVELARVARDVALGQVAALRRRVGDLESEAEALLGGVDAAELHYQTRLAQARAALSASEATAARHAEVEALRSSGALASAEIRRELERLEACRARLRAVARG
jgi:chromosome segregation ATPase